METIREEKAAIDALEAKKAGTNAKIKALKSKNSSNLDALDTARDKAKRAGGKVKGFLIATVIIFGLAILMVLNGMNDPSVRSVWFGGGAITLAITILFAIIAIKHNGNVNKINVELKDYYQELNQLELLNKPFDDEIAKHEMIISNIRAEIAQEELRQKLSKLETCHLVIFATSEWEAFSNKPNEPISGKKYKSYTISSVHGYINGMTYGSAECSDKLGGALAVINVDEVGTQKTEIMVRFKWGNELFERISEPFPVKYDQGSKFVRVHLSTCDKGTQTYYYTFDNASDFLKNTGLNPSDLV